MVPGGDELPRRDLPAWPPGVRRQHDRAPPRRLPGDGRAGSGPAGRPVHPRADGHRRLHQHRRLEEHHPRAHLPRPGDGHGLAGRARGYRGRRGLRRRDRLGIRGPVGPVRRGGRTRRGPAQRPGGRGRGRRGPLVGCDRERQRVPARGRRLEPLHRHRRQALRRHRGCAEAGHGERLRHAGRLSVPRRADVERPRGAPPARPGAVGGRVAGRPGRPVAGRFEGRVNARSPGGRHRRPRRRGAGGPVRRGAALSRGSLCPRGRLAAPDDLRGGLAVRRPDLGRRGPRHAARREWDR